MGLTPVELEGKEFSKARKGYNSDEVDKFFKLVLQEYEALYRENHELKETCNRIRQDLGRYKTLESTITETLVTAQKAGEDSRTNAAKEAELIIKDATLRADELRMNMQAEADEMKMKMQAEIEKQEAEYQSVVKKHQIAAAEFKLFLTAHLEMLERNRPSLSKEEPQEEFEDEAQYEGEIQEIYQEV